MTNIDFSQVWRTCKSKVKVMQMWFGVRPASWFADNSAFLLPPHPVVWALPVIRAPIPS